MLDFTRVIHSTCLNTFSPLTLFLLQFKISIESYVHCVPCCFAGSVRETATAVHWSPIFKTTWRKQQTNLTKQKKRSQKHKPKDRQHCFGLSAGKTAITAQWSHNFKTASQKIKNKQKLKKMAHTKTNKEIRNTMQKDVINLLD